MAAEHERWRSPRAARRRYRAASDGEYSSGRSWPSLRRRPCWGSPGTVIHRSSRGARALRTAVDGALAVMGRVAALTFPWQKTVREHRHAGLILYIVGIGLVGVGVAEITGSPRARAAGRRRRRRRARTRRGAELARRRCRPRKRAARGRRRRARRSSGGGGARRLVIDRVAAAQERQDFRLTSNDWVLDLRRAAARSRGSQAKRLVGEETRRRLVSPVRSRAGLLSARNPPRAAGAGA